MTKEPRPGGSHVRRDPEGSVSRGREIYEAERRRRGAASERTARRSYDEEPRTRTRRGYDEEPRTRTRRSYDEEPRTRTRRDYDEEPPRRRPSRKKRRRRAMRRLRTTLIVLLSLAMVLAGTALYLGSSISNGDTILPKVSLKGEDVGGLTKEQAAMKLRALGWEEQAAMPLTVSLPSDVSFEIDRAEAGVVQPMQYLIDEAFAFGHTGSWIADLKTYIGNLRTPVDLGRETPALNTAYVGERVRAGLESFRTATTEEQPYVVDKENECLLLRKGAGQLTLSETDLGEAVRQALTNGETSLSYGAFESLPAGPDFAAIYQALAVDPQDAYFLENWDVVDEIVGCTFDVTQANTLWENAAWLETVQIPLTITYPDVTGEGLRASLFRDLLGSKTTTFPYSIPNRVSNINKAAGIIDGTILLPGESFSYNTALGERTEEAGYLLAGAYSNGEEVEEIGGGICQVSSTLYCSSLYAQLGITGRQNHYFMVAYIDWGQDATVSWPKPDLVITNTRDRPIRINAYCDTEERYITVEIWGTNTDQTRVELRYERYRRTDETWTDTIIGWNVYLYADIYDANGNLIRTEKLPDSTYTLHDEDIQWPPEKYAAPAPGAGDPTLITFG